MTPPGPSSNLVKPDISSVNHLQIETLFTNKITAAKFIILNRGNKNRNSGACHSGKQRSGEKIRGKGIRGIFHSGQWIRDNVPYLTENNRSTAICGLNSLSKVNRRKRETESQGQNDWPWMATILDTNGYVQFCGGTLLNRQYILTAAHCFAEPGSEKTKDDVVIRLGEYDLFEDDETKYQDIFVKTIETHESYDPSTKQNDIALVKLERSVEYNQYVRPLCLPNIDVKPNETIFVAGWGATESEGEHSSVLLDVAIPVVDHNTCADLHGANVDKEKNLCAGTENKDSCQGDSGGPLLFQEENDQKRWMIAGIVSWGRGCGDYTPGVYTNVRHYMDWIGKRFTINGQEILHLFDAPYLLKGIRNYLSKLLAKLYWGGKSETVSWKHIEILYKLDDFGHATRIMAKLTDGHIFEKKMPKMWVYVAAQVLSHTVGSIMNWAVKNSKLHNSVYNHVDYNAHHNKCFEQGDP
ncbi:hypothetical protein V9T40_014668 [Parthenolecanium corni]|uniref:Peptidase S1 domain-containing protein n=1 Tax=Parthenolecanium corni TaxID=536013 RepID=A0AAN9T4A4_9HEMI